MISPETLLLELAVSFIFGFAVDFADLLDEHGLSWFPGAALFFGVVWGVAGATMIFIYPPVVVFVFGLVLYWLAVKKIDYLNHQIAVVIIFLAVLWQAHLQPINFLQVFVYLASYLAVAWVNSVIKKHYGKTRVALVRHYLPTVLLSLVTGNPWFILINIFCTAGVYASDVWFRRFEKSPNSNLPRMLGLSIQITKNHD